MSKKYSAFTLIELMIVVVIIGILAAIGLGSYNQYILKTKLTEAYTGIDVTKKNQLTYFSENKYFIYTGILPNDASEYSPYTLAACTGCGWDVIGYPFPNGSKTFFKYLSTGLAVDGTGSGYSATTDGVSFGTIGVSELTQFNFNVARCNPALSLSNLGISSAANSYFLVVSAAANFKDPGDTCTLVIQATDVINMTPKTNGFILLNLGE